MTDSMKFIPVPKEIYDILGFTDDGIYNVEISEGKLVLTQESKKKCILPAEAEAKCDDCCFCCPNCGECLADHFVSLNSEDDEETYDDCDEEDECYEMCSCESCCAPCCRTCPLHN